jgi:hypothetical protein
MKERGSAQEKQETEMADNARKNYEQAMKTGLRMQEEAARWWSSIWSQTAAVPDWQKRVSNFTALASGVLPLAQKRMEEVIDLIEKNSRTSAELMKKAVDAAQTPVIADSQAKWMEFWTSSMGAMRSNVEALTEINSRAIDSCIDFVRKNTEVTEVRAPKA